jgi:hypothetical protein
VETLPFRLVGLGAESLAVLASGLPCSGCGCCGVDVSGLLLGGAGLSGAVGVSGAGLGDGVGVACGEFAGGVVTAGVLVGEEVVDVLEVVDTRVDDVEVVLGGVGLLLGGTQHPGHQHHCLLSSDGSAMSPRCIFKIHESPASSREMLS